MPGDRPKRLRTLRPRRTRSSEDRRASKSLQTEELYTDNPAEKSSDFKGIRGDYSAERYSSCSGAGFRRYLITSDEVASVLGDISPMVWIALVLTVLFVFICERYDLVWNIEVNIVIGPLIFPLAFSINASYQRRERVLEEFAALKSSMAELYWAHRDWTIGSNLNCTSHAESVRKNIINTMDCLLKYLTHESRYNREVKLGRMYRLMSRLSKANTMLIRSDIPGAGPLAATAVKQHNEIVLRFERLRSIREYMTPRSVRNFFKVFVFLIPMILAPYFVAVSRNADSNTLWGAYFSAVVVTLLFGALQSVQDGLDDPFDGIGEDDVSLYELSRWPHMALWARSSDMPPPLPMENTRTTWQIMQSYWNHMRNTKSEVADAPPAGVLDSHDDSESERSVCTDQSLSDNEYTDKISQLYSGEVPAGTDVMEQAREQARKDMQKQAASQVHMRASQSLPTKRAPPTVFKQPPPTHTLDRSAGSARVLDLMHGSPPPNTSQTEVPVPLDLASEPLSPPLEAVDEEENEQGDSSDDDLYGDQAHSMAPASVPPPPPLTPLVESKLQPQQPSTSAASSIAGGEYLELSESAQARADSEPASNQSSLRQASAPGSRSTSHHRSRIQTPSNSADGLELLKQPMRASSSYRSHKAATEALHNDVERSKREGIRELDFLKRMLPSGNEAGNDDILTGVRYSTGSGSVTVPSSSSGQTPGQDGFSLAMQSMQSPPPIAQRPSSIADYPTFSSAHSSHSNIPIASPSQSNELSPPDTEPWLTTPPSNKHTYVDLSDAEEVDDVDPHVPVVSMPKVSPPSTSLSPVVRRRSQLSTVVNAFGDVQAAQGTQTLEALDLDSVAVGQPTDLTSGTGDGPKVVPDQTPDGITAQLEKLGDSDASKAAATVETSTLATDTDRQTDAGASLGNGSVATDTSRTNLV
eukprot:m.227810 g.227810  ORF g.227810 m.227810 type:complete len:926 (-) comp17328_c0_seq2:1353-4130(-)